MNITFLIGNGFDLNLGLKTSFKDFLNHYTTITYNDTDVIKKFKSDIADFPELWSDVELALGQYTDKFNGMQGALDYIECFENIREKLCSYLQYELKRMDISMLTSSVGNFFAKSLIHYKDEFRDAPRHQLVEMENRADSNWTDFRFITFNYTNILDRIIEDSSTHQEIQTAKRAIRFLSPIHIHGHTKRDAILGLNHLSQIANRALFDELDPYELDLLIKSKINSAYENTAEEKAKELINSADVIYIYGMALGDTDALWWRAIINAMIEHTNLRVIIHVFNCPSRSHNLRAFQKNSYETKKRLLQHRPPQVDLENKLMPRIHIADFNIFDSIKGQMIRYLVDESNHWKH